MEKILNSIMENKLMNSIIIIIVTFIIYEILKKILIKLDKNDKINGNVNKRGRTYFRVIISGARYIFIILAMLIILQINGVDVSSLLAGIGILSVVIGLAVQDALKDIIRGTTILSDNYFSVGDVVKYGDIEGKVIAMGLKTTKIKDIKTGYAVSIANRNIEQIQVVSNLNYIKIPMPYEVSVDRAEEAVRDIVRIVKNNKNVDECKYKGVTELADSSIQYLLEVSCRPDFKLQVRRDTLRSILIGLSKNNIEVPFNQIDIHNK